MTDITAAKTWAGSSSAVSFPRFAVSSVWQTLLTWQSRATQRAHLAELEGRLLEDMGMTRSDAERECRKPFWSA